MIGLMVVHYASLCKSLHVPSSLCICIGMEWSWLICTEKIWNGPGSYVLRKFGMVLLYRGNGPCVRDWMCWPMVPNGSGLCVRDWIVWAG